MDQRSKKQQMGAAAVEKMVSFQYEGSGFISS